jgi:hypothetical protein
LNTHEYNTQELGYTIKRPNLRSNEVEEGAEIQTKGIGNLFNERIAENLPNLCNNIDTVYTRHLELQIDMTRKEHPHVIS